MWILCTITFMSTVFPVSGSTVCGWWHVTQSLTSCREPPWADRTSWHSLHAAFVVLSQVSVTS